MSRGIGLAEPVAAVPVDQGDPQRRSPASGLAKQVDGNERAAGPAADDRINVNAAVTASG
jgi:hypothetical protein